MEKLVIEGVDVHFLIGGTPSVVNMSVQESYNVLMMPSFGGLITHIVPHYGLPTVPEPENKE